MSKKFNFTVKDIVRKFILENEYDGLYDDSPGNSGCYCRTEDLIHCGLSGIGCCKPGYYSTEDRDAIGKLKSKRLPKGKSYSRPKNPNSQTAGWIKVIRNLNK